MIDSIENCIPGSFIFFANGGNAFPLLDNYLFSKFISQFAKTDNSSCGLNIIQ